jgi:hypothetical protein
MKTIAIVLCGIAWIWIIYEFINAPLIKENETPNH